MPGYAIPQTRKAPKLAKRQIQLIANGDLRSTANQKCWPEQAKMEDTLRAALRDGGYELIRAHPYKELERHGFIGSQKEGMQVFSGIDPDAPLIVAEAVWQYSHHLLHGLLSHRGPILTVANWSGTWPGLVGMLNLNGSLTKAGVKYSTIWSEDFADDFFLDYLAQMARQRICQAQIHPRHQMAQRQNRRKGTQTRRRPCSATSTAKNHHGRFRRRVHGDVQRDHPRQPA